MKKYLLLILVVAVCGCDDDKGVTEKNVGPIVKTFTAYDNSAAHNHKVVVIDGCEYIGFTDHFGDDNYTHKGNCTNQIHIYNKK